MKAGRIASSVAVALSFCAAARAGTPPTAKIMVNPVPAKVGPPYPPLVGGGPNIVGNELRLDAGGVRVWVEVQFKDWDPNGDGFPGARIFQVTLDGNGLLDADTNGDGDVSDGGDQEDIAYAMVPCTSDADCWAAFGERLFDLDCNSPYFISDTCLPVYTDKNGQRPDGWCAGGCSAGSFATFTGSGWSVSGVYADRIRPDDGTVRWGATAVYDVPPGAKGKYAVKLNTDETFLQDGGVPPGEIPTLSEMGFVVNILTGRCCFGFGTPTEGCVDAVTRAECGNEPRPVAFTPEERCPPDGPNCGEDFGACCDTLDGTCAGPVAQIECRGGHSVWTAGVPCSDAGCTAGTGACCNPDPLVPCTENVKLSECLCATCIWHKLQACADIDCPRSNSIPTASNWGLAVLSLLLMIGAKIAFRRPMARRT
jgi:hypothetical protein